jgi:hypothetical protein
MEARIFITVSIILIGTVLVFMMRRKRKGTQRFLTKAYNLGNCPGCNKSWYNIPDWSIISLRFTPPPNEQGTEKEINLCRKCAAEKKVELIEKILNNLRKSFWSENEISKARRAIVAYKMQRSKHQQNHIGLKILQI